MNISNKSSLISLQQQGVGWQLVVVFVIYLVEGLVVGGTNFFIAFLLFRFKALRCSKEFLVIMSISMADGCNMMGYVMAGIGCRIMQKYSDFTSGIRRIYLVLIDEHNSLKSPWECTIVSHNLIWSFSDILSGLVLLVVSVDRLLSVAFPLNYISWPPKYVLVLFGSAFLYSLLSGTALRLIFYYPSTQEEKLNRIQTALCFDGDHSAIGVNYYYSKYRSYSCTIFALTSILIYGVIWILYTRHKNRVAVKQLNIDDFKKESLQRQRRLTRSLGISCLCTLFVYAIPIILAQILYEHGLWTLIFWVISNLNPLCNFFIYYYRQPELKQALKALFTCKVMPGTLSAWKANSRARQSQTRMKQIRNNIVKGNHRNHVQVEEILVEEL